MLLTNVLRRVRRRSAPTGRPQQTHRQPGLPRRSFVPRLELLEQRTVPSTWTVTSPADSGEGGGLYVAGGTVSVLATAILHNHAFGGDGDPGRNGGHRLGRGHYVAARPGRVVP